MFRQLFFLALLPLSLARPFLLGYSPSHHFACSGTSCPEQSSTPSLTALLDRLSTSSSSSSSDLPLHPDFASQARPSLLLVIRADVSAPRTVLPALSAAIGGDQPTSFIARAGAIDESRDSVSVKDVANLKISQKPTTVNVNVNAGETAALMDSIRTLARRDGAKLAVVWASRADADAPDAPAADQPASEGDAAAAQDGVAGADAPADDAAAEAPAPDAKEDTNAMKPPEINSAGLAGLLVALIFLLIFIPGFLCLTNITAPESFEIMDSNDVRKKMQ